MALDMSQAISVAFDIMAFTEVYKPLVARILESYSLSAWAEWLRSQPQSIGITELLLRTGHILTKGAELGVKVL